jgi:hypothetical protein
MNFEAKRIIKTATFMLNGTPQQVFPLLCPERELDWLPGWEYEMIYSQSGYNEEGCIFRTTKPYGVEIIWSSVNFDSQNYTIDFLNVASGLFVIKFGIQLVEMKEKGCEITFTQIYTGISEAGNRLIEDAVGGNFQKSMAQIEKTLNHYLATGSKLNVSAVGH